MSRNSILFVGYCDPDTPGGQLLQSQPGEEFDFEEIDCIEPIRAKIQQFDLSGHADREELLAYAEKLSLKPFFFIMVIRMPVPGFRNPLPEIVPRSSTLNR